MIHSRLICRLIGHNIDPCDCYATECFRCGLTFDWDKPPRNDLGFWLDHLWLIEWATLRPIRWWLKCPTCGGRFGRHVGNCPF